MGYTKTRLPVLKVNRKSWVTSMVFCEYFSSNLQEESEKGEDLFKIVILDNAASVPLNFDDLSENTQVVFLNTTLLF
jgi:hypothetical protein